MQTSTQEQRPSLWTRIARALRLVPALPATTAPTPAIPVEPTRYLGGFERRPDGHLVITHLLSTDILFDLGCQAGDVVISLDGVDSPRIPDDMLYTPSTTCTRAIITRDSVLIGYPASEYGEHPDPEIRNERVGEMMGHAMRMINTDPLFPVRNRLEGPPPSARADTTQPETIAH